LIDVRLKFVNGVLQPSAPVTVTTSAIQNPTVFGSNGQITFNDGGHSNGALGLLFDKTANNLTVSNTFFAIGLNLSNSFVNSISIFANSTMLGTNSDTELVSSKAIKTYVDQQTTIDSLMDLVAGNGLSSNTTSMFVPSSNGLVSNSSGLFLNINWGLQSNTSGIYILANAGITVNASGISVNAAYIATLAANSATYIIANTGLISNSQGVFVDPTYIGTLVPATANNTNFVGSVSAANVVSNSQLQANLANYSNTATITTALGSYQTTAGLASNVAVLAANAASYIGALPAANVVSNAQLTANLSVISIKETPLLHREFGAL